MEKSEVIHLLYRAIRGHDCLEINNVTVDGDHNSCEIILTTDDGENKQDWVISSNSLVEAGRDYDEV